MLAIEIVDFYYKKANIKRVLPAFKEASVLYIENMMKNGVSEDDILNAFDKYIEVYEKYHDRPTTKIENIFNIEEIQDLVNSKCDENQNLIKPNKIYYHKALRIISGAPIKVFDKEKFEFKTLVQNNNIKIKKIFTVRDLIKYFYCVHEIHEFNRNYKRDYGGLLYIFENLKTINLPQEVDILDLVLYTIDVSKRYCEQNGSKIKNIVEILDYIEEAMDLLIDKINHEKINNIQCSFE